MGRYQPKLESIEMPIYMVDYGSRLTDFSQTNALSDDNFVIFRQTLIKLEIWVDINQNLSPLKRYNACLTIGHV